MPDPLLDGQSRSLTPTMKRHLRELRQIADDRGQGEAFWRPTGGEWRTAIALADRGLLRREYGGGAGGSAFSLTTLGREAVV